MAGGAVTPTAKGGRKSLDAAINLVPFIDLLSCCISFLLITAVWHQLAIMPVSQGGSGGPEAPVPEVKLTLHVRPDGFLVEQSTGDSVSIDDRIDRRDLVQLAEVMQELKKAHPDKQDITVHAEDRVAYLRVVQAMDILRAAKFPEIRFSER